MNQPASPGSVERYCPTCEKSFRDTRRCPDDGTELVVLAGSTDPLLGRSLQDRYTILERLGAGGMGTVYRALQHSVGREVAIKVVNPRLVNDAEATKRFLREAKLASRFNHPAAVGMLDFGQTDDGLFYLVMELLAGRTLDKVLRDDGRLPLDRVGTIAEQICGALEAAHKLQIVHRDLKPANVMLLDGEGDLIKVLDFGLAKSLSPDTTNVTMTNSGALLGTPAYMSPEAAMGRDVDARCDLYSLGVMLYVLASGRLPFNADNTHEMLAMQAHQAPLRPPGVPDAVAAVIMRLLEKDPADRFLSAAATRKALDIAINDAKKPTLFTTGSTLQPENEPATPVKLSDAAMASTLISSPGAPGSAAANTPTPKDPAPAVSVPSSMIAPPARRSRRVAIVFALVVLAIVGVIALKKMRTHTRTNDRPRPVEPAIAPPADATEATVENPAVPVDAAPTTETSDAAVTAIPVDAAAPVDAGVKKPPPRRPDAGTRNGEGSASPW